MLFSGSSDDELCVLTNGERPPVQFRTTPPLEVHKPLRTVSPPSKMLGLGSPPNQTNSRALHSADSTRNVESSSSSRSARSNNGTALLTNEKSLTANGGSKADQDGSVGGLRAASPRKRHRHTPRHHNRPSLDFEKMQQVSY